jgi:hypothetical protein
MSEYNLNEQTGDSVFYMITQAQKSLNLIEERGSDLIDKNEYFVLQNVLYVARSCYRACTDEERELVNEMSERLFKIIQDREYRIIDLLEREQIGSAYEIKSRCMNVIQAGKSLGQKVSEKWYKRLFLEDICDQYVGKGKYNFRPGFN